MTETQVKYLAEEEAVTFMVPEELPPEASLTDEEYAVAILYGSYEYMMAGYPIPEEPEFASA